MDITQNSRNRQYVGLKSPSEATRPVSLSPSDRRLLFGATLCLLLRRSRHNLPVTADDLLRLIPYTDPDATPEMERVAA